jgi:hypothetical protein
MKKGMSLETTLTTARTKGPVERGEEKYSCLSDEFYGVRVEWKRKKGIKEKRRKKNKRNKGIKK